VSRVQRTIAAAATDAVAAARTRDAAALTDAVTRLSTVDPARLAVVLGWMVRSLLEERHPDGLDGEDLRALLTGCATACGDWESEVDTGVLLVVLTGALGLSDPDEQPVVAPAAVARNAALLVAYLLSGRALGPYLDAAFAELRRSETIEMP
jgi:hypothetical protein